MNWDWELIRTLCWIFSVSLPIGMLVWSEIENRHLKKSRDIWKQYSDEVYELSMQHSQEAYERSIAFSQTVREGLSKEVSLALDTLIAADALTEREKSVMLAIAYHAAPIEKDGRLLSSRILSQLAFEDAIACKESVN